MDHTELVTAVEVARERFGELKKKYPELKAYLVFSRFGSRSGQCDLTTDGEKILAPFPEMVVDDSAKKAALIEFKKEKPNVNGTSLSFHGDVLVELRFKELRYELIRQVQKDSLIDPDRSEVGSIRAVLGVLGELGNMKRV